VSGPALVWIAGRLRGVARLGWRSVTPIPATAPASAESAAAAPALALAGASGAPSAPLATDAADDADEAAADDDSGAEVWAWDGAATGDWRERAGWRGVALVGAALWTLALLALLLAAAVYPTLAVATRTQNLSLSRSLDGTAYMSQDAQNVGDAQAIAWLNTHVTGDPVIVEAAQYNEYTHLGRVSAFTGLPTIIGWGGHEEQWRYNWLAKPGRANVLGERLNAVKLIYSNTNNAFVLSLLRSYDVRYVYVGAAERQTYGGQLNQFAAYLTVVYQQAGVTIYEVPGSQGG
ncbi:MAG: hypothetical protein KGO05_13930, partial [Chloroflexota bacterium]|nr:hypothetical protein [Chloroflexota bacterium]